MNCNMVLLMVFGIWNSDKGNGSPINEGCRWGTSVTSLQGPDLPNLARPPPANGVISASGHYSCSPALSGKESRAGAQLDSITRFRSPSQPLEHQRAFVRLLVKMPFPVRTDAALCYPEISFRAMLGSVHDIRTTELNAEPRTS